MLSEAFLTIKQPTPFLLLVSKHKPNTFPKFKALLDFIAQDNKFQNFSETYEKNLSLIKESQRMSRKILGGHEIEIQWFKEGGQGSKALNQSAPQTEGKNLSISRKALLIWLVSIFELMTDTTFQSFVKKL